MSVHPQSNNTVNLEGKTMHQHSDSHPSLLGLAGFAALMALTVSYSIDAEALDSRQAPPVPVYAPFEPPTLAPSAIVLSAAPAYRLKADQVQIFFAANRAVLPPGAEGAFKPLVQAWQQGQRLHIAGFHDSSGHPRRNAMLAKERAQSVQKRLLELGVAADAIVLQKTAVAQATDEPAQARRVEVQWLP